jgi:hypothetical protein
MKRILALVCLMATAGYSAIQTAGDLLIDINASASAVAGNGAKLASVANSEAASSEPPQMKARSIPIISEVCNTPSGSTATSIP